MANSTPVNLWKAGQSGNPAGRPPGQSDITKLRAMLMPQAPELLETVLKAAKGGDMVAARLILERILPAVKPTEQALGFPLVGKSLADKGMAVMGAVSAGELSPSQGSQLITAIGALARVVEIDELERRITELEKRHVKP
jgi:hypothetical protein